MSDLGAALALVLVLEGAMLALFPGHWRRAMEMALAMPPETLRMIGAGALGLGAVVYWLVRG